MQEDKENKMSNNTAIVHKEAGNKFFKQCKYDEAIDAYSKAISKNNSDPAYFTNRALCYMNLKKWHLATDDCRRALELDQRNVKANYFLGKIYFNKNEYEDAILLLSKAHEAAYSQKLTFGDEITSMLRQAKREKFRIEEEKRIGQEIELQSYLNELIDKDMDNQVNNLLTDVGSTHKDESVVEKIEEIKELGMARKKDLNNMFAQIDDRRRKRDIPDYLCGKISFELLKEPVISGSSGITYDKKELVEHLQRVGRFDPITREPLEISQLIPNLAMKEVIDAFISENEWALDF
ncbi:hypothetical protein M3Y94_00828300 [Aphelenchoides besseyi]|nr:hypothetical protein M3Y94_00828300 [Aphelenchoides besseyi]KAI6227045.1 RING-type E3 ubiquitin transferase [Aphelenchoides besseyi]